MPETIHQLPLPDHDINVLEQARLDANRAEPIEPPKSQLEFYREWLGDDQVDRKTAADFVKYLESRPSNGPHFDPNGDFVAPNRTYTNINGTALTPHDVKDDILRFYYRPRDEADYQASNERQLQEHKKMSMSSLAKALGQAEIDHDRTKADDLTDELIDKLDMFAKKQKTDLNPQGMSPESEGALLDRIIRIKDEYKASLLPPDQIDPESKATKAAQQEKDDQVNLAADARAKAEQAHQEAKPSPSETPEPAAEADDPDENNTDQQPGEEQLEPESDRSEGRAKRAAKAVKRFGRRLFNRSPSEQESLDESNQDSVDIPEEEDFVAEHERPESTIKVIARGMINLTKQSVKRRRDAINAYFKERELKRLIRPVQYPDYSRSERLNIWADRTYKRLTHANSIDQPIYPDPKKNPFLNPRAR